MELFEDRFVFEEFQLARTTRHEKEDHILDLRRHMELADRSSRSGRFLSKVFLRDQRLECQRTKTNPGSAEKRSASMLWQEIGWAVDHGSVSVDEFVGIEKDASNLGIGSTGDIQPAEAFEFVRVLPIVF